MDATTLPTPEARPTEALPGTEERLPALDLLRGIAILGILPSNIPYYSGTGDMFGGFTRAQSPADHAVIGLTMFFVLGKFITLLSILFGAGLAIQAGRAWAAGRPFTGYYLWRMVLLFLIGLAHGLLLWYGDILTSYALVGAAAVLVARLGRRGVAWFAAACLTYAYGMALIVALAFAAVSALAPEWVEMAERESEKNRTAAAAAVAEGRPIDPLTESNLYLTPANEARIYRQGTFGEMVLYRAVCVGIFLVGLFLLSGWYILGCFLLGVYFLRRGLFHDLDAHRPLVRRLLLLGVGLGVPLHAAGVALYLLDPDGAFSWILVVFGGLPLALGYLALALLWSHSGRAEWLQRRFRAVGRLALSNYLLQSVLCTFVFYGYGLGLFGRLSALQCLGVVGAVWLVSLIGSPVWLHFFQMGPVEWAWRSLADLRARPFLRRAPALPQPSGAVSP